MNNICEFERSDNAATNPDSPQDDSIVRRAFLRRLGMVVVGVAGVVWLCWLARQIETRNGFTNWSNPEVEILGFSNNLLQVGLPGAVYDIAIENPDHPIFKDHDALVRFLNERDLESATFREEVQLFGATSPEGTVTNWRFKVADETIHGRLACFARWLAGRPRPTDPVALRVPIERLPEADSASGSAGRPGTVRDGPMGNHRHKFKTTNGSCDHKLSRRPRRARRPEAGRTRLGRAGA